MRSRGKGKGLSALEGQEGASSMHWGFLVSFVEASFLSVSNKPSHWQPSRLRGD